VDLEYGAPEEPKARRNQVKDDDTSHLQESANSESFASTTVTFTQCSPRPGPSPVAYLGGGRIDPFSSCAAQCNTMESFLLDHCKCSCFDFQRG
jgi:hypothetical protein